MNIIEKLEQEQVEKLADGKPVPDFRPGDTVRVRVKVIEGNRERIQAFEGVCIDRSDDGLRSTFRVRKISYGEGVERTFPLYSPRIEGIDVVRRGKVRRAKLYYLRGRTGKAARIAERAGLRRAPDQVATAAEAEAAKMEPAAPVPEETAAEAAAPDAATDAGPAAEEAKA